MKALAVVGFNLLLLVTILEAGVAFVLHEPWVMGFLPGGLGSYFREFYMRYDRSVVQFDPCCARFDAELGYRLRPGSFVFEGREFRTEYRVNSAGLRDDEASLDAPDVIVVGDSFAMGWGVEQEETFAQRIEQRSGLRVLNAGIASYGTAREMKALDALDTSKLSVLVVQYEGADWQENRDYADPEKRQLLDEAAYQAVVERQRQDTRYYPGRYALLLARDALLAVASAFDRRAWASPASESLQQEVDLFLHTLGTGSRVDLSGVRIVVVALRGYGRSYGEFLSLLEASKRDPRYPDFIQRLVSVDLGDALAEHAFFLDDHLRAEGHARIAERVLEALDLP